MILFIGPCENKRNKDKTGGIIILFKDLLVWSKKNKISYQVIDTNKENYRNKAIALFFIYYLILKNIKKVNQVSLHGTANDYLYIAPFIIISSKIFNKKVHLRKFAGNFDALYLESNPLKKLIFEYVLTKADLLFFETKKLVSFGKSFNKNTFWLPNTREKLNVTSNKSFNKKFVFISQVKNTKGIIEILKAKNMLPVDYVIDIFGPILKSELELGEMESVFSKSYNGVLNHNEVKNKLSDYDVLLLPTYHEGEGYPGIILESFSLGIPVISTLWNSIEELVHDNFNGFLVPIKDYEALKDAILKFNEVNYKTLSKNALEAFEQFDRDTNYQRFITLIQ